MGHAQCIFNADNANLLTSGVKLDEEAAKFVNADHENEELRVKDQWKFWETQPVAQFTDTEAPVG